MPLPVIPGVVRCSVRGTNQTSQQWVNVLHWLYADGASNPGPTEITSLDVTLVKFFNGPSLGGGGYVLGGCADEVKLVDITYYPLDGSSLGIIIPHAAQGLDSSGQSLPAEVAFTLTLRTNFRGRRYRGRIYLVGGTVGTTDGNGNVLTSRAAGLITQWNGMVTEAAAKQWKPVVASYGRSELKNGTISTWTPFATPITSVTMDSRPDVQRRRK
jgi:hypothetical protein